MASSDMKLDLIISAQDLASKEIEGIRRKLDDLTKSTSETGKNSDGVFSKMKLGWAAVGTAIVYAGSKLFEFGAESVQIANSYESAFAGVKKTVDGTTADFVKLDNTLKKMNKTIPASYEELAGIMELGGQLGVGINDLEKFTTTISQLGTATNLANEEAAQMLAQFANITGMDLNNIDRLGATIVDLGNNFATTEADIVNFASRIAGAGNIAGLSESQIMGIATAFSSVGIEAEAGGTAVQKVLLQMNNAANLGGDALDEYSKAIGMTSDEFKKLRDTHPEEVFQKFLSSLNEAGSGAAKILTDLGLKDERLTRAFLSLGQNSEILTDAISRGNQAWNDNIALVNEANQRYSTTESQLIMLQNERANAMAEIGEKLTGVQLTWEKIKTAVVETTAELMGANLNPTELTDTLEGAIADLDIEVQKLTEQYYNGVIGVDEYTSALKTLGEQKREYEGRLETEKDTMEKLTEEYSKAKENFDYYSDAYAKLMEQEKAGLLTSNLQREAIRDTRAQMEHYKKTTLESKQALDSYQESIVSKNEQMKTTIDITGKLTSAETQLKEVMKQIGNAPFDLSKPRSQMDATEKKALQLIKNILKLKVELFNNSSIGKAVNNLATSANETLNKMGNSTNPIIKGLSNQVNTIKNGIGNLFKGTEKQVQETETKIEEIVQETGETIVDTNTNIGSSYAGTAKKISEAEKEIEKADKEHEKITQELIDSYKKLDEQDAQSTFKKISEETDNALKRATSLAGEIENLNKKIADLGNKKDDDIADAFLDAEEKAKSLEKEFSNIESIAQNISKDQLEDMTGDYWGIDVDKIKEYIEAKETMASAFAQGTEEEKTSLQALIDGRREYNELNKVEQILWTYKAEKEQLEQQRQEKMEAFQEEQANAEKLAKEKIKYEQEYFDKLNYDYVKEREMYDSLIQKARELAAARASAGMGISGARAEGGPVTAGSTYLVGEKGPELFVPKTSGEIVPNEDLNKGGGDINISINGTTVNNQSDIDSLVDTLIRRIKLERNFGIA